MLFNSFAFLLFFPSVCFLYWLIREIGGEKSLALRNFFLLVASYYFYMCWQPKYALLLLLSTTVTYGAAIAIDNCKSVRGKKLWLGSAITINLLILFFYKYYGFVTDTIVSIMSSLGVSINIPGLDLLLPVGISFYIFQVLGYMIDVYRGETVPEKNFFTYALFVSFFPQLIAGPIERSRNLLRQFKEDHPFNYDFAMSGFKLMLWGYFLKLCLADHAALYVDQVFNNLDCHDGNTLIASFMFTLQIYGDFAGYTFIAIGSARILGISLNDNFRRPYFAVSITDFWRRWHISLSTWLRDYIYFPLGGSRTTKAKTYRNLLITFGISGLWHGANWTFVVWGFLHGIVQCIERALGYNKKEWHSFSKVIHIIVTLLIVNLAWMLFRANSIGDAYKAFMQMISPSAITLSDIRTVASVGLVAFIVFVKEFFEEFRPRRLEHYKNRVVTNYLWPLFLLLCIGCLGVFEGGQFIYFQF
jgi:alginate O-acetyltransferase complex protein AlgI